MLMAVTQPFKKEKPLLCQVPSQDTPHFTNPSWNAGCKQWIFFCGTGHCFHRNCFCCLKERLDNSRTIQRYKKGKTKDCFIHTNELLSRAYFECVWKNCARVRASFNALFVSIQGYVPMSCTANMILFSMCLFLQMLSKLLKYSAIWKNIMHRFKFVVKNVRGFKSCGVLSPVGCTTIKLQKSRSSHHLIQENFDSVHFRRPNFRLRYLQN